mgnify:CR=1 FL=1
MATTWLKAVPQLGCNLVHVLFALRKVSGNISQDVLDPSLPCLSLHSNPTHYSPLSLSPSLNLLVPPLPPLIPPPVPLTQFLPVSVPPCPRCRTPPCIPHCLHSSLLLLLFRSLVTLLALPLPPLALEEWVACDLALSICAACRRHSIGQHPAHTRMTLISLASSPIDLHSLLSPLAFPLTAPAVPGTVGCL